MLKLIDFLMDYFVYNYNYLMNKRESLKRSSNEYVFYDCKYDYNKFVFDTFINSKINGIKNTKVMEKSLNM